ncbi:arsenate reductase [Aliikangiella marina]|uniref:Arsenate reductase n=1 Tax=Aliikangiella marina TaxID=1712262 RepID=A0A545TE83_9GAMM|nr:arsenate reductase [Aliikangiella marina]TQV75529.1 arsenate reductase [Aliikangiella marina]
MKIYGIKNCDTVKKALKWLDSNSLSYEFHDFKKEPLSQALVDQWFTQVDLEKLINKRGTTWRQLDESQKDLSNTQALKQLVIEKPTLVKRPVVENNGQWSVGFKAEDWQNQFL